MESIKVVELFAGVGGFRVGLEKVDKSFFRTIWANQWEPSTKTQHAAMVYNARFGAGSVVNIDINQIPVSDIPNHDMLVGGFPCQDYSVATSLKNSKGIEGKKGVLWWSIYRILKEKGEKRASIVLLENVDRLLLSPASQRGRDFAIILECLNEFGYIVEWRVINAAEYGMPQRRRRTYIVAYQMKSKIVKGLGYPEEWILKKGVFAKAFPVVATKSASVQEICLSDKTDNRLLDITENFNVKRAAKPFENSGLMIDGVVYTIKTSPIYDGVQQKLQDVIAKGVDTEFVTEDFYIPESQMDKWIYFKGAKREERVKKDGFKYFYTEGGMEFPDSLDKPSRTIITSEGGKTPDRCRHVIKDETGRFRRLIPLELERLNMFPDHHTRLAGVSDSKRAFLMGNALVCGIVTKIGEEIMKREKEG